MSQYDVSPYSGAIPSWPYQNPLMTQFGGYQSATGQSRVSMPGYLGGIDNPSLQNPAGAFGQPDYMNPFLQTTQHLSPERFAGSLGRQQQVNTPLSSADAPFITELARCSRGLQEVAEQFEGKEPDTQRRAFYAATAHLFYALGLLSSKGIFITGELPMGRGRLDSMSVPNACREFGKQLERFVDKYASGRGVMDELANLVERGKICYTEISKSIEVGESSMADQMARKKVA
jgi:hypothetical protein